MKVVKTWLVIVLVSIGIFYFGKFENSQLLIFIGIVGIASGGTCEISSLITQFIKRHEK